MPVGLVLVPLVIKILKEQAMPAIKKVFRMDYLGFGLLVVGIFPSLQIMFDKGQQLDWFSSPVILTLGIASSHHAYSIGDLGIGAR